MTTLKHALKSDFCVETESHDHSATVANDMMPIVIRGDVQPSQITPVCLSPQSGFRFGPVCSQQASQVTDDILVQSNALSRIGSIVRRIQTVKTQILESK